MPTPNAPSYARTGGPPDPADPVLASPRGLLWEEAEPPRLWEGRSAGRCVGWFRAPPLGGCCKYTVTGVFPHRAERGRGTAAARRMREQALGRGFPQKADHFPQPVKDHLAQPWPRQTVVEKTSKIGALSLPQ